MKQQIKNLAVDNGAAAVGIASVDRLESGIPSMDPTFALPEAKSIISVMLPLDGDVIRKYLAKQSHEDFQQHESDIYRQVHKICKIVENFLNEKGYKAVALEPNLDYRFKNKKAYKKVPYQIRQKMMDAFASKNNAAITLLKRILVSFSYERYTNFIDWRLTPSFSHRYGAVATGLGNFGWSSNVLTPDYGARVLFDTVITNAELEPDPMMQEKLCDGCRICTRVCQVGMIHPKKDAYLTIGGQLFRHGEKGHNLRCIFCCAGFTGQSKYKEWSTWSPGRITLPDTDDNIEEFWNDFAKKNVWKSNYYAKVLADLTFHNEYGFIRKPYDRFQTTCGNCQIVCWKTLEERKENYNILINSGEVAEGPDFSFKVVKK